VISIVPALTTFGLNLPAQRPEDFRQRASSRANYP